MSRGSVSTEGILAILDGLPGMVGCWDRDLRNVLANSAYREYFGFSPEQMRGIHIREVLGERVYAANRPYMDAALAGEEQLFDRMLVDISGRVRHLQASYVPWRADDQVVGFVVMVTDVTERVMAEQRARRSAAQYRALAQNVPGGFVLLFDEDLRFVVAEGPELATFGYSREELEGRTLWEAFPGPLAVELEPLYRAALQGRGSEWERTVADRTFALSAAPVPSDEGQPFAGLVIARDITQQRRTQATWSALHAVARAVARNAAPETVAAQIATSVHEVFLVDSVGVVRFTGEASAETIAIVPEQSTATDREWSFIKNPSSATAQVARTGMPARVTYDSRAEGLTGALHSAGMRAGAAAPIRHLGQVWGAIAVAAQDPARVSEEMLDRLAAFAELVEIALGNLEAWSTLTLQATVDSLTGLPNRRTFEEHLTRETQRATGRGQPLSLVLIDLDRFKAINDTYGHPVGDQVLTDLASRLTENIRSPEVLARIGGEEFAWLLPNTDTSGAVAAAERARRAIAELTFDGVGPVTISLGVASTDHVGLVSSLVDAADRALYEAKRRGRNRTAHVDATTQVVPSSTP